MKIFSGAINLFLIFGLFQVIGCKSDVESSKGLSQDQLLGKWEIGSAYKAGNNTKLLSNGFFEFNASKQIRSNVLPIEDYLSYTLNSNQVLVNDSRNSRLTVEKVTSDTLTLSTEIRNVEFKFILLKAE